MENLSIDDRSRQLGQNASPGPPSVLPTPPPMAPQLPPQMFTTAAQLLDLTDKKLLIVLRDGRKLIGVLRSWDQFANLVLQDTVERLYAGKLFADKKLGIFVVRGENVLLLGEIDLDMEDDLPKGFTEAPLKEVEDLHKKESQKKKKKEKTRNTLLRHKGFEGEIGDTIV